MVNRVGKILIMVCIDWLTQYAIGDESIFQQVNGLTGSPTYFFFFKKVIIILYIMILIKKYISFNIWQFNNLSSLLQNSSVKEILSSKTISKDNNKIVLMN